MSSPLGTLSQERALAAQWEKLLSRVCQELTKAQTFLTSIASASPSVQRRIVTEPGFRTLVMGVLETRKTTQRIAAAARARSLATPPTLKHCDGCWEALVSTFSLCGIDTSRWPPLDPDMAAVSDPAAAPETYCPVCLTSFIASDDTIQGKQVHTTCQKLIAT
jgi:hypothetical protein